MIRLKTSAFVAITLIGVSIGANNMTRFEQGQKPLSDRAEYCEWISFDDQFISEGKFQPTSNDGILFPTVAEETYEKVWSLAQKLKPYRSRKVKFEYLPHPVGLLIQRLQSQKQFHLANAKKSLQLINDETKQIKSVLSHDDQEKKYQLWKLDKEIPEQLARLNAEILALESDLSDYANLQFDDIQVYRLFRQTYLEDVTAGAKTFPFLALELEYEKGWFGHKLNVYPIWIEDGVKTRAGQVPYFSLSGSMIPEALVEALAVQKLPSLYQKYLILARSPPTTGEQVIQFEKAQGKMAKVEFLSARQILVLGTPYSNRQPEAAQGDLLDHHFTSAANFAVDSLLDLGCIKDSRWARRLIRETELLLGDPQLASIYEFKSVDLHNMNILEILKSLNPVQDRRVAQAPIHFWRQLFSQIDN